MSVAARSGDERMDLHSLISLGAQLIRQYPRSSRGDARQLREQAQALVDALDEQHPAQSTVQQVFALLRDISIDNGGNARELARNAELLAPRLESNRGSGRTRSPSSALRDVDAWMLEMFRATESAIPRETLVSDFVTRFRRTRSVTDSERHGGPWLFIFEASAEQGVPTSLKPVDSAGVHPSAFAKRCAEHAGAWMADPFLQATLLDNRDVDGWYALAFGGSPLFDSLLDINRRFGGEADYWVSGVSLPGDATHDARAVMVLYPNAGDSFNPEPPPGIRQDVRLLTVLGLAWRQLEHQVRALARISEADRRDLINLIAPGLLHHEIGFNMRTAYGQLYEQHGLLLRTLEETGRADVAEALDYSQGAANLVLRLYRITEAFNNLDKRGQLEESDLEKVLDELKLLLHHRLGSAFTDLTWDADAARACIVHTDVVLLSQALLNLFNNALNALTEGDTAPPRRICVGIEDSGDGPIVLTILNNGPEIVPSVARDMFRRGYTTRARGHGQGLYLARLVSHYLGGELTALDKSVLPAGFNVGFRFTLQRRLSASQGVAGGHA